MNLKISLATLLPMFGLWSSQAIAGGLYLYEVGGEDVGLASAGLAARAQDAGTILGNPAGMTRLGGDQLSAGAQVLTGNVPYHLNGSSAVKGDSPGNVIEPFPSASLFYSHSVDDRLKLGIGLYGNYGLALHYGDWAAQRLVKDATLTALTLQPTVAYKVSDHWSLGAGVGINYGYFSLTRQTQDGEQKEKDHDWAVNAHVGVLYELNQSTRVGLTYTSETDYSFKINPTATLSYNGPGFTLNRDVTLPLAGFVKTPQQVMFSAFHEINAQWNIMGNLGWQNWSRYSESDVVVAGNELAGSDKLRDTWHAAVGAQYQLSGELRLDGGIAYDSSFYKSQSNASLTMPSGAAWRFGLGAQYRVTPKSTLGASFEFLRMQGSTVQSPLIGGQFNTNRLYFIAVNYSHEL